VAYGGGISINSGTLDFTTVVSNTASGNLPQGGGIYYYSPWDRTVNLKNSIFGDNHGPSDINGPDLFGTFTSQDYNLIKNTSGFTINGTTTHNITWLTTVAVPKPMPPWLAARSSTPSPPGPMVAHPVPPPIRPARSVHPTAPARWAPTSCPGDSTCPSSCARFPRLTL
jgi:hypothetical protein